MALMNRLLKLGIAAVLAIAGTVALASDAKPAKVLLDAAHAQAKREKKNVLVVFDASW